MKKLYALLALLVAMLCPIVFSSCSDDGEGGLSGVYVDEPTDGYADIYYFMNSNTLYWCNGAHYGYTEGTKYYKACTYQIGNTHWYSEYPVSPLTYAKDGNKIYVTNGTILTISGNTLLKDGYTQVFTKEK
jgi:hypothetical protein